MRLRARRAELLGYRDHAEFVIAEQTAPDPSAVDDLLRELNESAMRAGGRELTRLTEFAGDAEIGPADLTSGSNARSRPSVGAARRFRRLLRARHRPDARRLPRREQVVRPAVRRADRPARLSPDVRVWEVRDDTGTGIGLFLGDFYARPSKRGGAWMNNIVDQSSVLQTQPIIVNVLNLTKPDEGQPCLLSIDQLTTLFHEFGHALHGLLSSVEYPSQSGGTSVPP